MGKFAGLRRFKTAQHVHTRNSDGADYLYSVIEQHYSKGYDILAITDHNVLTRDWVMASGGVTQSRFDQIAAGAGRNGRHMLQIPNTNEQSYHDHVNTFFVQYQAPVTFRGASDDPHFVSHGNMVMEYPGIPEQYTIDNLRRTLQETQLQNGLSHLNHPGRYTGSGNPPYPSAPSNNPANINKYVDLFMSYSSCVGLSIINKKDGESRHDRILWDNINSVTIPQGRYVWGFSNDDTHNNNDTGFSFNVFVMPQNTLEEFRKAMQSGSFYAVAKIAHNEGVNSLDLNQPPPVINDIDVRTGSITIVAENYTRIDWITSGTRIVAQGNTVAISAVPDIGVFIRANVIGDGGVAFSQPWRIDGGQVVGGDGNGNGGSSLDRLKINSSVPVPEEVWPRLSPEARLELPRWMS